MSLFSRSKAGRRFPVWAKIALVAMVASVLVGITIGLVFYFQVTRESSSLFSRKSVSSVDHHSFPSELGEPFSRSLFHSDLDRCVSLHYGNGSEIIPVVGQGDTAYLFGGAIAKVLCCF